MLGAIRNMDALTAAVEFESLNDANRYQQQTITIRTLCQRVLFVERLLQLESVGPGPP